MVFKLMQSAQKKWRKLKGFNLLQLVVNNVKFKVGVQVTEQSNKDCRLMLTPHLTLTPLITGFGYFIEKLIFWNDLSVGIAPLIIGGSLAFSFIVFFLGIIG